MRIALSVIAALVAISTAAAETPKRPKPQRAPESGKALPFRGTNRDPCAAYGAGFVRVEGTGSCVKIGGSIDVGVGVSGRR